MADNTEEVKTEETKDTEEVKDEIRPEGPCEYEIDVNINSSVLYDYLLRHMYNSAMGLLATCLGAFMIIIYFVKGPSVGILYPICGVVIIFYSPISLFFMAKRQALTESFQKPLHYAFYENGFEISQDDRADFIPWENTLKAVATGKSIIVYTGKNAASIFPRADLKDDAATFIKVLSAHMDPAKVRIRQ